MDPVTAKEKYLSGMDITEEDIKKSIEKSNPLSRLSDDKKIDFLLKLDTRGRFIVYDALRYWRENINQEGKIGAVEAPSTGDVVKMAFPNINKMVFGENLNMVSLVKLYNSEAYTSAEKAQLKNNIVRLAVERIRAKNLTPEEVSALESIGVKTYSTKSAEEFKKIQEEKKRIQDIRDSRRYDYPLPNP
jgi:hypothetical protein